MSQAIFARSMLNYCFKLFQFTVFEVVLILSKREIPVGRLPTCCRGSGGYRKDEEYQNSFPVDTS